MLYSVYVIICWCVHEGYVKCTVWRCISNTRENMANIMSTGCGSVYIYIYIYGNEDTRLKALIKGTREKVQTG